MGFRFAMFLEACATPLVLGLVPGMSPEAASADAGLVYEVSLVGAPVREIKVRADISGANRQSPIYAFPRFDPAFIENRISEISCDGTPLPRNKRGVAEAPAGCKILSWISAIEVIGPDGILVEQQSFVSPDGRRGLLSGAASLLRLSPPGQPPTIRVHAADSSVLVEDVLPPLARPPYFLPFGDWPIGSIKNEDFELVYYVDDPEFLGGAEPWPEHLAGSKYMDEVLGLTLKGQTLRVVWLGRRDEEGNINGAAGDRVLLLNYTRNGERLAERERTRSLLVLLHEQLHQLGSGFALQACAGDTSGTAWLGESIATYYALKALRQQLGDSRYFKEIWAEFIGHDHRVEYTFKEVEEQIASGDWSNRQLFNTQGATFWSELDNLIQIKTKGAESLDNFIGAIQAVCPGNDEDFSGAAAKVLPTTVTDEAVALFKKYVG